MIKKLTADQIYNLMVEQPGSAEGRDVAVEAVNFLDSDGVKSLRNRITKAAIPTSKDYEDFKVPFARGYLLGQLGKITGNDIYAINLLLKHLDPEVETDHWVRFWALSGVHAAKINKTPQIAQWIVNRFDSVDPGKDYKSLLFANAVLAEARNEVDRDAIIKAPIEAWLNATNKDEKAPLMLPCQDALRVLGFVSRPGLTSQICNVFKTKGANPRTLFLACQALAALPESHPRQRHQASETLVGFLKGAGNTRILLGVREEALQALARLKDPTAEHALLKEIRGGCLNLVKAASRALGETLGIEKAVERIMVLAGKDENPHTRKSYSVALRWMSEDRDRVTEALDVHMNSGKLESREYARTLMAELGGRSASERLSARSKVVNEYQETLLAEQAKFQLMFDNTILEARQGFKIAIGMDVIVFSLGMLLLIASGIAAMFTDGSLDNWVGAGMGGVGVLGIVYGTLIANPRKKVFSSVNTLMNYKIIFLAYLRQLHQNDQSFTRAILDDSPISLRVLEEYFIIIGDSLQEAVDNMIVLKAQELKEKIADYEAEVANRELEVRQRIGDVNAGIGVRDNRSELEARISQIEAENTSLAQSIQEKGIPFDDLQEGPVYPESGGAVEPGAKPGISPGPKPTPDGTRAVPKAFVDHLVLREGWVEKVYRDSLGKPTAGLGHLLKSDELTQYKVGQTVPTEVLNRWAQHDSKWAYEAGITQSKEAGIDNQAFQLVLGSVNFQLGPAWRKKFPGTWRLIANGEYLAAAKEAANSQWFKQTPVRTMDLQRELLNLAGHPSDYNSLNKLNATQIQRRGVRLPSKRTYDAGAIHGGTKTTTKTTAKTTAKPVSTGASVSVNSLPSITASVGKGGVNKAKDVLIIQQALLTIGYLKSDAEYKKVMAMEAGATVTSMPDTIVAIGYFQIACQGSKRPDKNVGANGRTFKAMKARVELINSYKSKKISASTIAPVVPEDKWITQAGHDKYPQPTKGRKLKRSEVIAARPKDGATFDFWKCCMITCDVILKEAGVKALMEMDNRVGAFFEPPGGAKGFFARGSAEYCAKYIDEQLQKGRPVLVGVDHTDLGAGAYNYDLTTDHFVICVGKVVEGGRIGFRYYDVGTTRSEKGTNPKNVFWLDQDEWSIVADHTYNSKRTYRLSHVRQNA